MTSQHTLGELQLAIMRVLWKEGEATVAHVHEALSGARVRALTTIATMLSKMEKKGVVRHRTEGRLFVYEATVSEQQVKRTMVADLAQHLFEGDYKALVSHLIDEEEIDARELDSLKRAIAGREKKKRKGGGR
jgi:BlaI family transcriptional regulator, penicillinase repressor